MLKASLPPDTALPGPVAERRSSLLSQLLGSREFSVLVVLALLAIAMASSAKRGEFYSAGNLHEILLQVALLAIFAIGETIVIITGGIDLSLGSLIAYTGMLLAWMVTTLDTRMYTGAAVGIAVLLTLLFSLAVGAWHTVLIHRVRLPAFVVTLVSLLTLRSQALVINHHQSILVGREKYPLFYWLTNGGVTLPGTSFEVPIPAILLVIVGIATHIILTRTRVGRYLYSIGSNEQATQLSGVNVFKVKLFAYGASALLGGLAGILWVGYGGQGNPQTGNAYELDAVAAAVVGGASLNGGQGSVLGTVVGALLLHSIFTAINLTLSEPSLWRGTVVGGILLLAVLATAFQQRGKRS